MRGPGDAGREDLRRVHARTRGRGRDAEAQENTRRRQPVCHAHGAIDHLGGETHGDEQHKIFPHAEFPTEAPVALFIGKHAWATDGSKPIPIRTFLQYYTAALYLVA